MVGPGLGSDLGDAKPVSPLCTSRNPSQSPKSRSNGFKLVLDPPIDADDAIEFSAPADAAIDASIDASVTLSTESGTDEARC